MSRPAAAHSFIVARSSAGLVIGATLLCFPRAQSLVDIRLRFPIMGAACSKADHLDRWSAYNLCHASILCNAPHIKECGLQPRIYCSPLRLIEGILRRPLSASSRSCPYYAPRVLRSSPPLTSIHPG